MIVLLVLVGYLAGLVGMRLLVRLLFRHCEDRWSSAEAIVLSVVLWPVGCIFLLAFMRLKDYRQDAICDSIGRLAKKFVDWILD